MKYAVDETTEVVKWKDVEHRIALVGAGVPALGEGRRRAKRGNEK